jgi:uncharacterized membrane protein YciS (DUF1049 family)
MILFSLGLLIGITLCIFIAILNKRLEHTIERTVKQIESKLKPKGNIIDIDSDELEVWVEGLGT